MQSKRSPYFRPASSSNGGHPEGLLVDLMEKVAADEGFTFDLLEVAHKGHPERKGGNWTGVLGHLVRRASDEAIATVQDGL